MSGANQDNSQVPDKDKRIEFYLKILGKLKERSTLREVLEREVFLEFIKFNNNRINEFPLLEKQQSGIIALLCHRSLDLPSHEFVKKTLSEFILMLGRYGKLKGGKDQNSLDLILSKIINAETLLIKTVQGVVYASCLVSDNFEEVTLRHFGEPALKRYNALLEQFEMGTEFWQELITQFITQEVDSSLVDMIANDKYTLTRDKSYLILRFLFDDVTGRFASKAPGIDKTRIQNSFEQVSSDPESVEVLKMTYRSLLEGGVFIRSEGMTNENIEHIARIVCIDPATTQFSNEVKEAMGQIQEGLNGEDHNEKEEELARKVQFSQDQIGACAIGVSMTLDIVVRDFFIALRNFTAQDEKIIEGFLRKFEVESLDRLFFYLTEMKFSALIKKKIRGEESKLLFRVLKRRRACAKDIADLDAIGMTKIRKSRLWLRDSNNENWLIFKQKNAKELLGEMQLLALDRDLITAILKLYEKGDFKTEILVLISLQAIAKVTKDIRGKLNELLIRFGIGAQSEEQILKKLKAPVGQ
ncbi:hypothetical protein [Maridesulfovibrio ferrireducens]|uniref:hypothetical protein n=1 Tax=Maridesulfovibrio ferrireducens TaxID=246191 RepID=UPI001A2FFD88|nr:hypothetical protein [Maridesulfovibrio ferrireducens]MBI9112416.1 hypothetical protein [Maridesulfovibrio ferrireducens]